MSRRHDRRPHALKHGKTAAEQGYAGVVDRYTKGKRYSDRMAMSGVVLEMMEEWDALFANREITPLPVYTLS